MAILPKIAYETFTISTSHRRALNYATAGANPNAFANGLGTALSANTRWSFFTKYDQFRHGTHEARLTVDAWHPQKMLESQLKRSVGDGVAEVAARVRRSALPT